MNYTVSAKNLVLKMIRVMVMMMMIWMAEGDLGGLGGLGDLGDLGGLGDPAVATAGSPSWPLRPPSGTTMPTIPTLSDDLGSESFSLIAHAQAEGLDPAGSSPHNYPLGTSLTGVGAGAGAGAWALHQMTGDGNCQFRALAHHLHGNQDEHHVVRAEVVARLIDNRRQYENPEFWALGVLPAELDNYNEYVEGMTGDGEWGDDITLQVASDIYNVSINVVTPYTSMSHTVIQPRNNLVPPDSVLWLSHGSNHYNLLTPTGECDSPVQRGPLPGANPNPRASPLGPPPVPEEEAPEEEQVPVPSIDNPLLYPPLRVPVARNKCVYCRYECPADNHRLVCASCGINTAHQYCEQHLRPWGDDIEQPMINGSWYCSRMCYLHCPKSELTPGA